MRKKEDSSEREKVECTQLNKTVKKRCRQRSRKNEHIMLKLIFKLVVDQNIYTKEDQKKKKVK